MSLTQHEIVRQLGISRGTLHRILIGSPLVKPATRERVLRELEKLHYVPNAIARGLKMRRTNTLGIVGPAAIKMANIDKVNALYLTSRARGYSVMFGYSNGSLEEDARCIRELRARMVDGFITLGRGLPQSVPQYLSLQEAGIPFVTLYPMPGLLADCVYVDTRRAYGELTRHLINLGHTKIGLLLDASSSQYSVNRELGFRDAMTSAGLPVVDDWIIHVTPDGSSEMNGENEDDQIWHISDYQYGFWGASLILAKRQRPTALVCFSDEFAIGVLRAADLAGIRVPEELALVGYDDKDSAKFARVPLTTMHQPDNEVGAEAVSLLIDRIDGKIPPEPVIRPLEAKLVIRDSCGAKLAKTAQNRLTDSTR
jgi:LacI family transcriptional regulator